MLKPSSTRRWCPPCCGGRAWLGGRGLQLPHVARSYCCRLKRCHNQQISITAAPALRCVRLAAHSRTGVEYITELLRGPYVHVLTENAWLRENISLCFENAIIKIHHCVTPILTLHSYLQVTDAMSGMSLREFLVPKDFYGRF